MKILCVVFLFCNFCYGSEVGFSIATKTYLRCNLKKALDDYSSREFPQYIEVLASRDEVRSDKENIQGILIMTFASSETSYLIDISINRHLYEGWKTIRGVKEPIKIKLDMKKNESLLAYNYGSGLYKCKAISGGMH